MSKPPAPSDIADKFMLRMPDGMRDRLREAAEANNRSMNAEIIARLEGTFKPAAVAAAPEEVIRMTASEASIATAAIIMDAMSGIAGAAAEKDFRARLKEVLQGHLTHIRGVDEETN